MSALNEYARVIERRLNELIPEQANCAPRAGEVPKTLAEAMRYSLFAGGKRLRPAMLLGAYDMLASPESRDFGAALDMACAVEMIHTYSLIHDDLPGMDDDITRRGRPTNHIVYGVGQAILAGDGLLTMAFEVMLNFTERDNTHLSARVRAMREIARGAGVTGMVAGQCLDLSLDKNAHGGDAALEAIHRGKTMAMFVGAVRAGARLACADNAALGALTHYAEAFGLLFQASDDLLDVTASAQMMGKSAGKDERAGKLTAVSVLDIAGARARVEAYTQKAVKALEIFGARADFLRELATNIAAREA